MTGPSVEEKAASCPRGPDEPRKYRAQTVVKLSKGWSKQGCP